MQCYVYYFCHYYKLFFSNAVFLNIRVLRVRGGLPGEEERQERVSPVPRLVMQKAKDYDNDKL